MKPRTALAALCLLLTQASCQRPWPPGVIARWDGADIDTTAVERFIQEALDPALSGEGLVTLYRQGAEELCIRDRLVREHGGEAEARFRPGDRELTRRQITVTAFVGRRLEPEAEVTPTEIEAYYAVHPEQFHRPERRFIAYIFRRTGDETSGASPQEVLGQVRARFLAGEAFATLAAELSQSETAVYGGNLGLVTRGDLHETAEEAVFSLDVGEISRPVAVHGGYAVFIVTQVYPEKDFPLADVKIRIAQRLWQDELRRQLDAIADEAALPTTIHAVPEDRFNSVLESDDPEAILYSDDGLTLSVGEWRERLTGGSAEAQLAQYTDFLRLQRVYHHVVAEGFLDEPGRRDMIDESFQETLRDQIVDAAVEGLLVENATNAPRAVEAWFDANRERYQTPVELLVDLIVVQPTGGIERTDGALRAVAASYSGGEIDREAVGIDRARLSRDWLGIAALDAYHPRVKASLLTLEPPACGPVFNIGGSLHLFCVAERKDPHQLSFDEARDRVVADYVAANKQELYAGIRAEILDEEHFEFNEARVREILHAPAAPAS